MAGLPAQGPKQTSACSPAWPDLEPQARQAMAVRVPPPPAAARLLGAEQTVTRWYAMALERARSAHRRRQVPFLGKPQLLRRQKLLGLLPAHASWVRWLQPQQPLALA